MIQEYVDRFMANEQAIRTKFTEAHPGHYDDIVRIVVEAITGNDEYNDSDPDPQRVHEIDDGDDYQGTLVYVIGAKGYQPNDYWYVKVYYGSCPGCDTLEAIREYSDDKPTPRQADDYWTLALHIVQKLTPMQEEAV